MTKAQVDLFLNKIGEAPNAWLTMDKLHFLSLESQACLFSDPASVQYYFDDANELLLVRHTIGKPKKLESGAAIPNGYASISHNGIPYIVKIENGGVRYDSTVGIIHEVVAYDIIVSFELRTDMK